MKTIVALTDFSKIALNALEYAADMAKAGNTSLCILHVNQVPVAYSEIPYPAENYAQMIKDAEDDIAQLKKDMEERTGGAVKVYTALKSGPVVSAAEEYCTQIQPSAVVMGTQGHSAVERLMFGSNTIQAMKHLSRPLIIVPPQAKFKAIRKIGLACDLKKVVETSPVAEVKELVQAFQAQLHILHVTRDAEPVHSPEMIEQSGLLQEMFEELHPSYHFLTNPDIEEGICEFADANALDLLIVVPKKHNLVDQLFARSHSKKMLLHTHVPLMAVHE